MATMPLFEIRGDAKSVAAGLRQIAESAASSMGNAGRPSPSEAVIGYLSWTEVANTALGNFVGLEQASDLLHTQGYWALRTADPNSAHLIGFVNEEVRDRVRVLKNMADTLERELGRWAEEAATIIVPDTNIFLQEDRPFEEIDWPMAVRSQLPVRLALSMTVIHELDRLKRTGNNTTRKMARQALRWMTKNLPLELDKKSEPLSDNLPVTTIEVDVETGGPKPDDADGAIIRFAKGLDSVSGNLTTRLVTYDLGMRLRAKALGVRAIQLPDDV